ncbi:unnamed protein product [Dovyalis caffra]|uniref:HMA domain-containing protein n=1 Tax=Dovyalis caffra TaxID=77055 RepID=A0AAV1QYL3_9ROSI|nr:unnamed protein product [Dovyalis caffra]
MALATRPKKEMPRIGVKKSKNTLYSGTSLASIESLTVPLFQEVVLSADIRCADCQKRVAAIMSRMNETESVSINVLEKKKEEVLRILRHGVKRSIGQEVKIYFPLYLGGRRTKHRSEVRDNKLNVPNKAPLLSLSRIRFQNDRKEFPADNPKAETANCCMELRINLDCNACCKKARRIILKMKEVEAHMIEKQQCRISICGRFRPSDVAIKLRKKMNRRVEILDIQEFDSSNEQEDPTPAAAG